MSTHSAKHSHGAHDTHGAQQAPRKESKPWVPEKYQDLAYCGGLILAILIFLSGAVLLGGNFFGASDNISPSSFISYLDAAKKDGVFPQWLPYIFSGLPSHASLLISGDRTWDFIGYAFFTFTKVFGAIFHSDAARVSIFYMIYAVGMYFFMRFKKHDRYTSFFSAFAAVFSTWVITWIMIGHNTKPIALMTFPYIFICLEKLREKFSFLYMALLFVAVHLLIESTHMQMIFYGVSAFGLYLLFELITRTIRKEQPMGVVRSALLLALAGGLAFTMASDRLLSTIEYTPYSTRGTSPIQQNQPTATTDKNKIKQDETGGFDYDYATNWSFSPEEMMTFLVPNYYGYGKVEYKGPATRDKKVFVSTYWGQMPFTDAANYMGIGVLMLAILGAIWYRRDVFIQFLIVLSVFALLLSFGKNLPLLYDLFFYHIPSFNKFRAPSMALALMQFAAPILAGYGIAGLLKIREEGTEKDKRMILYFVGAMGIFLVSGFLYAGIGQDGYIQSVAASATGKQLPEELHKFIYTNMISDWQITALLGFATMLLAYLFVKKKLSQTIFFASIFVLLVADLWRVDVRGMEISKKDPSLTVFKKTDVIDFLQKDNSTYRIADFAAPAPNVPARFFLQNIHGYHSAKLRVYQDLLDVAGNGNGNYIINPFLWNLLNVKYIVTDRPLDKSELGKYLTQVYQSKEVQQIVYQNPMQLPRAFFVNKAVVAQPMEILNHLKNGDFNPRDTAFVETAIAQTLDSVGAEANATVTEFKNETIKFDVNATGNNLMFISEVWYPAGWKTYIDGQETPTYKTNFAFRSIVISKGKHTVELKYHSDKFELGRNLSMAGNIIVILMLVFGIWTERKKKE